VVCADSGISLHIRLNLLSVITWCGSDEKPLARPGREPARARIFYPFCCKHHKRVAVKEFHFYCSLELRSAKIFIGNKYAGICKKNDEKHYA